MQASSRFIECAVARANLKLLAFLLFVAVKKTLSLENIIKALQRKVKYSRRIEGQKTTWKSWTSFQDTIWPTSKGSHFEMRTHT